MGPPSREWWCNADFDLTLAHGGGKLPPKILSAAREMPWHFWPAIPPADTLLVSAPPPAEWLEYLRGCGLQPPRFAVDSASGAAQSGPPTKRFTPFGWNLEAVRRNARSPRPTPAPDLHVVQKVNSRAFSSVKEKENFGPWACPSWFCRTETELKEWWLTGFKGRFVAKGNHGMAGIGQMRFDRQKAAKYEEKGVFTSPEYKALNRLRARMDGVALETEQKIVAEFGALFRLGRDGKIRGLKFHKLLSEIDGGYSGALVLANGMHDPILTSWLKIAEVSVEKIAALLCEQNYFGPVGVDMYVHVDHGIVTLRPLVDLNARCSMAWPVHGLAQCLQGSAVMVSQISTSSLFVPNNYEALNDRVQELIFTTKTRRGFIWLTPLLSLSRHSLAFVGSDEADVLNVRDMTLEQLALKG